MTDLRQLKKIYFVQRGNRTKFKVLQTSDGADKYSKYDLEQEFNMNILDGEVRNLIIVQEDSSLYIRSEVMVDGNRLLSDLQDQFPNMDIDGVTASPTVIIGG